MLVRMPNWRGTSLRGLSLGDDVIGEDVGVSVPSSWFADIVGSVSPSGSGLSVATAPSQSVSAALASVPVTTGSIEQQMAADYVAAVAPVVSALTPASTSTLSTASVLLLLGAGLFLVLALSGGRR